MHCTNETKCNVNIKLMALTRCSLVRILRRRITSEWTRHDQIIRMMTYLYVLRTTKSAAFERGRRNKHLCQLPWQQIGDNNSGLLVNWKVCIFSCEWCYLRYGTCVIIAWLVDSHQLSWRGLKNKIITNKTITGRPNYRQVQINCINGR